MMDEIIKQIAQIDSAAMNNKSNNEQALKDRKIQYEKKMKAYRETELLRANKLATELYEEMMQKNHSDYKVQEEENKELLLSMKNLYLESEAPLLNEVFNELFRMEE